ncbi:MAG TPA: hypothetical protein VFU05_09340 [Cyclobacteriaceae bacterium]|nr:hypothetical protein [Cyclobacteriaceae bacterium]
MSNKRWLKFFSVQWFSFAGLFKGQKVDIVYPEGFTPKYTPDPNNGIVVFFPPEHRYVEASGDQGVGKSSLLSLFKEAAGHTSLGRFINKKDQDKKYIEEFEGEDGNLYRVVATRTQFDLFQVIRDADGEPMKDSKGKVVTSRVNTPKEMVQKLVGPAGKSPMEVAQMKPADQVAWFRSVVRLSGEQLEFEADLNRNITTTYNARKNANQKTNELTKVLDANEYYKDHEKWLGYFNEANTKRYNSVDEEIRDVQDRYTRFTQLQQQSAQMHEARQKKAEDIEEIQEEIKRLHERLAVVQKEYVDMTDSLEKIDLSLAEQKDVVTEYQNSTILVREASEYFQKKMQFDHMVALLKDYNKASDEAIRLDHKLTKYRELKKRFSKEVAPPVEGLEVCTPDEEEKREGAFYKGLPLDTICESEQWEWYTQLAKTCGIRVMYIENISSLGSGSINKFNEFIEQGGYVFATRMDVEQKELRVTFSTKVPTYKTTAREKAELA